MKNVFIVRPFGTKEGVNFDQVEANLIRPVLENLGVKGGTTGEIVRSGNIRVDMFEQLVTADLVIADISIHNANVYYELGVRHALRDRPTILIRCKAHDVPFDLKTDRYLEYEPDTPEGTIRALTEMVEATLRSNQVDSPVHLLVPELGALDVSRLRVVPPGFREAVSQAESAGDLPMLGLLSKEAHREVWSLQGTRLVGQAQFRLGAFEAARRTWESVRAERPNDLEANTLLGTIYQRLGELSKSSIALGRVLEQEDLSRSERAETQALIARNLKAAWIHSWSGKPESERPRAALRSQSLIDSMEQYREAFLEDQNHYYSGLNALALCVVVIELSSAYPDLWEGRFGDPDEAVYQLGRMKKRRGQLSEAVLQSLEAAQYRNRRDGTSDVWLDLSVADHRLLESDNPEFVRAGYSDARSRLAALLGGDAEQVSERFPAASAAKQITLYLDLKILIDNGRAALDELGFPNGHPGERVSDEPQPRNRVIVSTGHRIDAPDRRKPRFPGEQEATARRAILDAVSAEVAQVEGQVEAMSGAASGNDILFQEICEELDLPSTICLPVPSETYVKESVAQAGPDWVERFGRLCHKRKTQILSDTPDLPSWMSDPGEYSVFQRANMWLLETAFSRPNSEVTLLALWNGEAGDGPGGTADMVALAKERGAKTIILDTRELFRIGEP